jgi:hypothetical protein
MKSKMMRSAQPSNGQRFGIIGMVHLGLRAAAHGAWKLHELAALEINVRVGSRVVSFALLRKLSVLGSPFSHSAIFAIPTIASIDDPGLPTSAYC